MRNADASLTNYGGRFLYIQTVEQEWPELLASLSRGCLAAWRSAASASQGTPLTFAELKKRAEYKRCVRAITAWADEHQIRDSWILDAASQTLAYLASRDMRPPRWVYSEPEMPLPGFEMVFDAYWIPGLVPWSDFRKNMHQQLSAALQDYHRRVAPLWGDRGRSHATKALWTVWWQRGYSPARILRKHERRGLKKVTVANIQLGVRAFASSIGLTLRAIKAGRVRKI
jgi:hypothetical protein